MTIDELKFFCELGWKIFPCRPNKKPIVKWGDEATSDIKTVEKWIKELKPKSWAVALGKKSGIMVLDVDVKKGAKGLATIKQLILELGAIVGPVCVTPSGGWHIYILYDSDIPSLDAQKGYDVLGDGLELKSDGHCCVLPGSYYDCTIDKKKVTGYYKWVKGKSIHDLKIENLLPSWKRNVLTRAHLYNNKNKKQEFAATNSDKAILPLFSKFATSYMKMNYDSNNSLQYDSAYPHKLDDFGGGISKFYTEIKAIDQNWKPSSKGHTESHPCFLHVYDFTSMLRNDKIRTHLIDKRAITNDDYEKIKNLLYQKTNKSITKKISENQAEHIRELANQKRILGKSYVSVLKEMDNFNQFQCSPSLLHDEMQEIVNSVFYNINTKEIKLINVSKMLKKPPKKIEFLIENLLPKKGLAVLAGGKHARKSFFILNLIAAVVTGGVCLKYMSYQAKKGKVLLLALEDSSNRIHTRLYDLGLTELKDENIFFMYEWAPKIGKEFYDWLSLTIEEIGKIDLLIIDTITQIKPDGKNQNSYDHDNQFMGELKRYAQKNNFLALCVTHETKKKHIDPLDSIQSWMAGAADVSMLVSVPRFPDPEAEIIKGELKISSRDIREGQYTTAITVATGEMKIDITKRLDVDQLEQKIIDIIKLFPHVATKISDIKNNLEQPIESHALVKMLNKLIEKGHIKKERHNAYFPVKEVPNTKKQQLDTEHNLDDITN